MTAVFSLYGLYAVNFEVLQKSFLHQPKNGQREIIRLSQGSRKSILPTFAHVTYCYTCPDFASEQIAQNKPTVFPSASISTFSAAG